uniref:Replication-associated protein n=1 Tax=Genomoviridae sp. TaxID=2202565 RepID=A0A858NFZ4_9VIRU|nr:MAG: replication-associated protein [Genomoviridae sp.]
MPSFDLHARYVLLTYPQCGELAPERVGEHLESINGTKCVIGRENHADGGIHLHCFIDFGRKRRFRNARAFDVEGHHPNVSPSKGTPEKGWDYATKDGDTVWATLDRPGESGGGRVSTVDKWTLITGASDRESFWSLVHELDPKSAACNFRQLQAYCDWKYAPVKPEYSTPVGISFVGGELDGRDEWVRQSGLDMGEPLLGRPRSLCMYGPSRLGKTLWARSLAKHVYCVGLLSGDVLLKAEHEDVKYAIFDDIRGGIKFFPSFKEWLGGQAKVSVKCLYREPKPIRWGKPSIWLSNTDPRDEMQNSDIEWMNANCTFIEVTDSIFHASTNSQLE